MLHKKDRVCRPTLVKTPVRTLSVLGQQRKSQYYMVTKPWEFVCSKVGRIVVNLYEFTSYLLDTINLRLKSSIADRTQGRKTKHKLPKYIYVYIVCIIIHVIIFILHMKPARGPQTMIFNN